MSETESTLQQWFNLKYQNYTLTPKYNEEHRKFFARRNIKDNNIDNHLKIFDRDLTAGITPKRLYYGNAGSGKSHIMLYVGDHLKSKNYEVCYMECPPLKTTDMPIMLFKEFVKGYGRQKIVDVFQKSYLGLMSKAQASDPELWQNPKLRAFELLKNEYDDNSLIEILATYVQEATNHPQIHRWLDGEKIKSEIPIDDLTSNTTTLAKVWVVILKLIYKITGKKLVLIFDELDNMNQIPEKSWIQFTHIFQQLTEDSQAYAAIVLCFTGESRTDNEIINEHVIRRILESNIIQIDEIKPQEFSGFCEDLIRFNRDEVHKSGEESCTKYQSETSGEELLPKYYPFTTKSLENIKAIKGKSKPGDIINTLNQACAEAKANGRHVVRSDDAAAVAQAKKIL